MSRLVDLEDFTSNQLRDELSRRQTESSNGLCWYCKGSLLTHTCKHAEHDRKYGPWEFEQPHFINSEDCMGNPVQYWRTSARHRGTGRYVIGNGETPDEATKKCITNTIKQ